MPVSLGIVLDTSGSMAGEKIEDGARRRSTGSCTTCSTNSDEMFLYRFSDDPVLRAGLDDRPRALIARARRASSPNGGTAMYDAVAEAVPLAQTGRNRKKALVVISDGNDTSSSRVAAR